MRIDNVTYVLTEQTPEEREEHGCKGCVLRDTDGCYLAGHECLRHIGYIYKEKTAPIDFDKM